MCSFKDMKEDDEEIFIQKMLADKPQHIKDNEHLNNLYAKAHKSSGKTIKIVQMSDLHLDLRYVEGSMN